jgi:CheY-like chemotaxis protein
MNHLSAGNEPRKYLLVDDHAAFRQTVRDFLPGHPTEVVECGDGREALAAYAHHQPDWTLMDVQMPELDGLKATRCIRSNFPHARIIILTQHDSPELRDEARAAGATAYILKDRLCDLPAVILSRDPSSDRNPESAS